MLIPSLNSERLLFFPLTLNFLSEKYLNWLNDPEVNKYLETNGENDLKKLEEYIKQHVKNSSLFWAIVKKKGNLHIGNIKIDPINVNSKSGEYGIMIGDKSQWGKGFAFEASERILKYCFNQLDLNSITLGVKKNNFNALKLYEKLGFVKFDSENRDKMPPDIYRMIIYNDK